MTYAKFTHGVTRYWKHSLLLAALPFWAGLAVSCGGSGGEEIIATWGGFTAAGNEELRGGALAGSLYAADMTGDGQPDLVMVRRQPQPGVFYRFGLGSPNLRGTVNAPTQLGDPLRAVAADLDQDGTTELISAGYFDNGFEVLSKVGTNGDFNEKRFYPLNGHCQRVAVADFNRDGLPDVVTVNGGSGQPIEISLFQTDRTSALTKVWSNRTESATIGAFLAVDATDDGLPDIVFTCGDEQAPVQIFPGGGDGGFGELIRMSPIISSETGDGSQLLAVTDVNGDAHADLLVTHDERASGVSIRLGQGGGRYGEPRRLSMPGASPYDIAVADFDHDNRLDLAVSHMDINTVTMYRGRGNGEFGEPLSVSTPTGNPLALVAVDLNGDQWSDLATLALPAGGNTASLSVFMNRGMIAVD